MPNFDEIYPEAEAEFESREYPIMVKFLGDYECWHCQKPTHWLEINFEAPICSSECYDAKWQEYEDACRAADERLEGTVTLLQKPSTTS